MKPLLGSAPLVLGLALMLEPTGLSLAADADRAKSAGHAVFVEDGRAKDIVVVGKKWHEADGYLECSGEHNYLYAGKALGTGDVHVRARLALRNVTRSAASFDLDTRSHFGFDGGGNQGMFVSGPLFGDLRFLGPFTDFLRDGEPFDLEVIREGTRLRFLIDGKEAYAWSDTRAEFGTIALRPWRATMRVYDFSASGRLEEPVIPADVAAGTYQPFTIPTIDLSGETDRHVIVAQGTADAYKGHPTTLLMPDGKTMFCVYPLGHGGPGAVLRRSDDAGLTWSEPLDVPENWRQSTNCPALYRLVGPDGAERLFVFEGNGRMRQAVSEDGGKTWSPMKENGLETTMPFTSVIRLRDGRFLGGWNWQKATWISLSTDGGLTWGPERCIARTNEQFPGAWPAEPGFVRSPDGREIACLMRENSRKYHSLVTFSRDEGETWTDPAELPRALTGDRHQPRYAPDGRLVIPFRDMAPGSPTRGHFVAWVGTYDDIAGARPGQYRVKLLHSHAGSDCGYPGLELLPDGTFVATTYVKYQPGPEKQSVVSVRFKLSEIDERAKNLPQKTRLLPPGPGNDRNSEGDFVQLADGRILFVYAHYFDHGPACLAARYSADGGETWTAEDEIVVPRQGDDSIRSVSLLRLADGRIALFYLNCTSWPDDERPFVQVSTDEAKTWSEPVCLIPDADARGLLRDEQRPRGAAPKRAPASAHVAAPRSAGEAVHRVRPDHGLRFGRRGPHLAAEQDGLHRRTPRAGANPAPGAGDHRARRRPADDVLPHRPGLPVRLPVDRRRRHVVSVRAERDHLAALARLDRADPQDGRSSDGVEQSRERTPGVRRQAIAAHRGRLSRRGEHLGARPDARRRPRWPLLLHGHRVRGRPRPVGLLRRPAADGRPPPDADHAVQPGLALRTLEFC